MSTVLTEPKPVKKSIPSTRKPAARRPKPLFDYDSPEFTEALCRHVHAAKRAALSKAAK